MIDVVNAARSYLGTPFRHQGRLPGVGLDCAGTIVCALNHCGIAVRDVIGYGRIPSQGLFTKMVEEHCNRIKLEDVQVGDFMMFSFRDEPQHIAIVSNMEPMMIIHSYSGVGRVVENSVDYAWLKRLSGCYRLKGK